MSQKTSWNPWNNSRRKLLRDMARMALGLSFGRAGAHSVNNLLPPQANRNALNPGWEAP